MEKKKIEALVEGGKASAGPPIGPALGPLGVNVGKIVNEINERTSNYEGITIPVKITIDKETKKFEIEVGSPPTSALILKELGIKKGSGNQEEEKAGDLSINQLAKISRQKKESTLAKDLKRTAKEVLGSCLSMGVTVDGKDPREIQHEIEENKHDEHFR